MAKDKRLSGLNIDDLLDEVKQGLASLEKKTCRRCKQQKRIYESGFCEDCWKEKQAEKAEKKANARHIDGNYVRVYRGDKLVYEHKVLMEEYLGRPLTDREVVIHRNGNTLDNDLSNLLLSLKGGTPFDWLVCDHCGTRGSISIEPLPVQEPPVPT